MDNRYFTPRKFAPLNKADPLVGKLCEWCEKTFKEGDEVTLLPKPETEVDHISEAEPVHWDCWLSMDTLMRVIKSQRG